MRNVNIAGREYVLQYRIRPEGVWIEKELGGVSLVQRVFNFPTLTEQAVFVAGGLRHADKKMTSERALALFQEHNDETGKDHTQIVFNAVLEMAESGLLGHIKDWDKFREMLPIDDGSEDAEGKD